MSHSSDVLRYFTKTKKTRVLEHYEPKNVQIKDSDMLSQELLNCYKFNNFIWLSLNPFLQMWTSDTFVFNNTCSCCPN